jgi:signal peptide peptidase SppA
VTDAIRELAAALAPSRSFVLDGHALAMGHASRFLAIDPAALGQTFALDSATAASRVTKNDVVAVVDIRGVLAQRAESYVCGGSVDGYDAIAARFVAALEDPGISAVMLRIDSPGGDCAGCDQAIAKMQRARDASGKHVAVYMDEKACSAAYALAMVASPGAISLPPSAITGSIGVLNAHEDASGALEKAGLKWTIIRSGARKAEANGLEPLTDAARAGMQEMVDTLAGQFFELVSKARGLSVADLRAADLLDGHVVMGREAVRLGLADKVEGWESALARASKEGRRAQKEKKMKAITASLGLPETATEAQALDKIEALKTEARDAKALLDAKALDVQAAEKALAVEKLKADVASAIDGAIKAEKIPPSAHAREIGAAYAAKHGLAALQDHYAAMSPQPGLKGPVGGQEHVDTAMLADAAPYETLTPMQRHNLMAKNPAAYAKSRDDWMRRGEPESATKH